MWIRGRPGVIFIYSNIVMRCVFWFLVLGLVLASSCRQQAEGYDSLRKIMVEQQIVSRGVEDSRVIKAMFEVPRHLFVPARYRHLAYSDSPVPIGEGQTISQPYIVALMSAELNLEPTDKVLEVGTGSGYQAAILAEMVKEVYTIEIIDLLGKRAEETLNSLGYANVKVRIGDGYEGWPEYAPFDKIIVTCAPTEIPELLVDQLKEGGLMVIPVGSAGSQYLYRVKKHLGAVETESVIPVTFVPLTGPHAR
jgi:protein-L-isoaspartate(D-aspartate) O-methyltransferase